MLVCEICGKKTIVGRSGVHQYGGGWARRAPKTLRIWRPNLQTAKILVNGQFRRVKICTSCLKRAKKEQKVFSKPATVAG